MPTEPDSLLTAVLDPKLNDRLSTQSYTPKPKIEGVRLIELRQLVDDGGNFMELLRFDESGCAEPFPGFTIRQSSISVVLPGAIKAFHLHLNQDDIWFIPPSDRMLVGLLDCRENSASNGAQMRVVLGAGRAQLLYIPRGVAHGVTNQMPTPGLVFYFVNQQFDLENPDEHRLPWDIIGEDFWKMTPG